MTATLYYGVTTGKLDPGGDPMEFEVDLTPEQEAAYKRALMTGKEFDDFIELRELPKEYYDVIEEEEIEILLDVEDEYTMECMGLTEVDPDEINDLVHSGDEHAIKFFKLEDLNEEELEAWDANELDELPQIADFKEDFTPESPFDNGWTLHVRLCDPRYDDCQMGESYCITKERVTEYMKEALKAKDFSLVDEVVKAQQDFFSENGEDIRKTVSLLAAELGIDDYT